MSAARRSRATDQADGPAGEATGGEPLPGMLASARDAAGVPIHHGWAPLGGRRRWMEPFLLAILSGGPVHGYAIIGRLEEMRITGGSVDVGQVYRTLRELEQAGLVTSTWSLQAQGPARREYELTAAGYAALDEWAAVMKERTRLIGEFDGEYFAWVARDRRPRP
ncbi:MAG: helix-turn-helix transcriptional regulator [Chloroflexi bacterium]|nr:helix-turn-helix transcriptional regulator [Chloroflexota bacterium]